MKNHVINCLLAALLLDAVPQGAVNVAQFIMSFVLAEARCEPKM